MNQDLYPLVNQATINLTLYQIPITIWATTFNSTTTTNQNTSTTNGSNVNNQISGYPIVEVGFISLSFVSLLIMIKKQRISNLKH